MKSRLSLLTVALLAFACMAPRGHAQNSGSSPNNPPVAGGGASAGQTTTTFPSGASAPSTPQSGGNSSAAASQTDSNPTPSEPAIQEPDPSTVKHSGGKDDVDAIGNRKMGGRGFGNWYSIDTDIKMGKAYAQQVEATSKMVTDPVVTEYINRLGQNLVRNSDAQVPFIFKVID